MLKTTLTIYDKYTYKYLNVFFFSLWIKIHIWNKYIISDYLFVQL